MKFYMIFHFHDIFNVKIKCTQLSYQFNIHAKYVDLILLGSPPSGDMPRIHRGRKQFLESGIEHFPAH